MSVLSVENHEPAKDARQPDNSIAATRGSGRRRASLGGEGLIWVYDFWFALKAR